MSQDDLRQLGNLVMPLPAAAEQASISLSTLQRLIAAGQGPKITRLSERRVGIRVKDFSDWLDRRAETTAA